MSGRFNDSDIDNSPAFNRTKERLKKAKLRPLPYTNMEHLMDPMDGSGITKFDGVTLIDHPSVMQEHLDTRSPRSVGQSSPLEEYAA